MALTIKNITLDGENLIELESDADTNDEAVREMESYCILNGLVRSREKTLRVKRNSDGSQIFCCLAYPTKQVGERARRIYDQTLRNKLEPEHIGELVAIDINTGKYELDPSDQRAVDRLRTREPEALIFVHKIGYSASSSIGGGLTRE